MKLILVLALIIIVILVIVGLLYKSYIATYTPSIEGNKYDPAAEPPTFKKYVTPSFLKEKDLTNK